MKYRIVFEVQNEDGIADDVLRVAARSGGQAITRAIPSGVGAAVSLRWVAVEVHDWKQLGV